MRKDCEFSRVSRGLCRVLLEQVAEQECRERGSQWERQPHGKSPAMAKLCTSEQLRPRLGCAGGTRGEMCVWDWLGMHNQKCWGGVLKKVQLHPEHKIKHAVENFRLPRRLLLCTKEGKKVFHLLCFLL